MASERRSVTLLRLFQMFVGFYFAIVGSGWALIEYHEKNPHPTAISKEMFKAERTYRTEREHYWVERDHVYVQEVASIHDTLTEIQVALASINTKLQLMEKK